MFYFPAKREGVRRKLEEIDNNSIYVSAISVYELIGIGAVPVINKNLKKTGAVREFERFISLIDKLSKFNILPYTETDEKNYQAIPAEIKRKGQMDCRIAASAITRSFIIVTEDTEVFELVNVRCENWVKAPNM
jgi:predicted nucleic acid-binding protein